MADYSLDDVLFVAGIENAREIPNLHVEEQMRLRAFDLSIVGASQIENSRDLARFSLAVAHQLGLPCGYSGAAQVGALLRSDMTSGFSRASGSDDHISDGARKAVLALIVDNQHALGMQNIVRRDR